MELEKITESAKNFLDDRLKNPYFASVIAVWIFCNRVLFFGLFNFDEKQSMAERISWVHQQLSAFHIWKFEGIYGGIFWALLWGFVTMAFFNLINGSGKALYKFVNKISIGLLQKVDPANWVSLKVYNETKSAEEKLEKELNEKKAEIARSKIDNEAFIADRQKLQTEIEEKNATIKSHANKILELEKKPEVETLSGLQKLIREKGYTMEQIREVFKSPEPTYSKPSDLFIGRWRNEFKFADGKSGIETFEVDENGRYMINGVHTFNIVDFNVVGDKVTFTKVGANDKSIRAENVLTMLNADVLKGKENRITDIIYTKILEGK